MPAKMEPVTMTYTGNPPVGGSGLPGIVFFITLPLRFRLPWSGPVRAGTLASEVLRAWPVSSPGDPSRSSSQATDAVVISI